MAKELDRDVTALSHSGAIRLAPAGSGTPFFIVPLWHLEHVFPASRTVRLGFSHTGLLRPAGAAAVARELREALGLYGDA
jgi:hypothetical protein